MGMFDEIEYDGVVYQTKSLSRLMNKYVIDEYKLYRRAHYNAMIPCPENVSVLKWWSSDVNETVLEETILQRAHGVIEIYDYDFDSDTQQKYYLKFTDDELVQVLHFDVTLENRHHTPSGAQVMDEPEQGDAWQKKIQHWKDNHYQQWLDDRAHLAEEIQQQQD